MQTKKQLESLETKKFSKVELNSVKGGQMTDPDYSNAGGDAGYTPGDIPSIPTPPDPAEGGN